MHTIYPKWRICICTARKSQTHFFKEQISRFYLSLNHRAISFENIDIIEAGALLRRTLDGIESFYQKFCSLNIIDCCTSKEAYANNAHDPFAYACLKALVKSENTLSPMLYDIIMVDDTEDLNIYFLKLCLKMLKEPQRLVYTYDNLQKLVSTIVNLTVETDSAKTYGNCHDYDLFATFETQDMSNDFTASSLIESYVSFDSTLLQDKIDFPSDLVLTKIYDKTDLSLTVASALFFASYAKETKLKEMGLTKLLSFKSLFAYLNFKLDGKSNAKEGGSINLVTDKSLRTKSQRTDFEDLLLFKSFESKELQDKWVLDRIKANLKVYELNANDIMIVSVAPRAIRLSLANLQSLLFRAKINAHVVCDLSFDLDSGKYPSIALADGFSVKDSIPYMLYIIDAQHATDKDPRIAIRTRAQILNVMSKATGYVSILGVGDGMDKLQGKFANLKDHDFKLD